MWCFGTVSPQLMCLLERPMLLLTLVLIVACSRTVTSSSSSSCVDDGGSAPVTSRDDSANDTIACVAAVSDLIVLTAVDGVDAAEGGHVGKTNNKDTTNNNNNNNINTNNIINNSNTNNDNIKKHGTNSAANSSSSRPTQVLSKIRGAIRSTSTTGLTNRNSSSNSSSNTNTGTARHRNVTGGSADPTDGSKTNGAVLTAPATSPPTADVTGSSAGNQQDDGGGEVNDESPSDASTASGRSTNGTARGAGETTIRLREPRYRPLVDTIVGSMVLGAILIIGVAGNAMVVAVVAQTRSMRTPTNCYLVSLSVADLMVLLSAIPNELLAQYILEDEWIFGRAGCALFVFFQYLGINVSSLSITAFTVERYIAICLPMKAQTMCTVKRAKKIILAVWLFALCYCCPWLFFLTTTRPIHYRGYEHRYMETCTYSLQRSFYMRFFFADIVLFYVIPLILSCVLYGRMARVLFHTDIGAMACKSNGDAKANANNQSRIQVVKMLIVVVVLFATLWLPYRVLLVYNSFASKPYLELWYLMLCKTLIFVNSAINPVLYNAMSVKFRRAFRRTLSCGCGRQGARLEPRGFSTVMTVHQQTNLHRPPRKDQY